MSSVLVLIVAAWVALIAVAFVVACVQAVAHLLPPAAPAWEPPFAPTLAEEARA